LLPASSYFTLLVPPQHLGQCSSQATSIHRLLEMDDLLQDFVWEPPAPIPGHEHEWYALLIQRDRHRRRRLTLQVDIEHHNVGSFI
jgi:hypothetical protein